jgi:hypothetical protein
MLMEAQTAARTAMVQRTAMVVEITPKTTEIKPKVLPITPITMAATMKTTKEMREVKTTMVMNRMKGITTARVQLMRLPRLVDQVKRKTLL